MTVFKIVEEPIGRCGVSVLVACAGVYAAGVTEGIAFWVATGTAVVATILALLEILVVMNVTSHQRGLGRLFRNSAAVVASIAIGSVAIEAYLDWAERRAVSAAKEAVSAVASIPAGDSEPYAQLEWKVSMLPEAALAKKARKGLLSMPDAWKKRIVQVEGAEAAYIWHGALHVFDGNRMRRTEPFPPKRKSVFRVMIVGDSLTYGEGVRYEWIYSSLLQGMMGKDYSIEFLNLGMMGNQSEDILDNVRRFLPELQPDLVIYGICQNDFLPSGIGQYNNINTYPLPIPDSVKRFFRDRTALARFLEQAYDATLRRFGLRGTFIEDILKDFRNYRTRFARDVKAINQFVTEAGLPPVVAMVLDQYPWIGGEGQKITRYAEQYAGDAGMEVIPTEQYYLRYDRQALNVSRWEGHPDEEAHAVFAAMIRNRLEKRSDIERYRKGAD